MERNIYKIGKELFITSDEEIKEGDWCIADYVTGFTDLNGNPRNDESYYIVKTTNIRLGNVEHGQQLLFSFNNTTHEIRFCKKVILTTDQDLIKDGVQAIDDEFLEWFVKNANESGVPFDRFEIEKNWNYPLDKSWEYKIIIPQEEPKQETLEEAAENYSKLYYASREPYLKEQYAAKLGFKDGAKWQAERMYNKEDTIDFAHFYFNVEFNSTMQDCKTSEEIWDLWIQQRKKK